MFIKALLMLIYYFFWDLRSSNINYCVEYPHISINMKTTIAKSKLLETKEKKDLIATISINKINIKNKPLYKIDSEYNDISKNITILKESTLPDNNNSMIILAAHSGIGPIAYFKDLYKLEINDIVELNYNNKIYQYRVSNMYEEDKLGYININKKSDNMLILTTCSKNEKKQLIIETILINKDDVI